MPAEPVLRGTVYDRRWRELAVSYRLFAVHANPEEIGDRHAAAQALAPYLEEKAESIESRLKNMQFPMVLAEDLDEKQAQLVESLKLRGLTCKAEVVRFYPGHTTASHVLGFMGDGVGLAGVEGKYDAVLQPNGFRKSNIPDIDFQGQESLGTTGADLVLTLDMELQKQLESQFRSYLASRGAEKGMGLLIEPGSGRILALVNQPSFNPNYFWKAKEVSRVNRIYNHILDKDLIRPILVRAAAIERDGLDGPPLLPPTVASPNYGFTDAQLNAFEQQIQLYGSVFGNWQSGPVTSETQGSEPVVTGVQVGVTLASLVNGGWRITPFVIDSLFDHTTKRRYARNNEATERIHVLDPALGVKIRRDLFNRWYDEPNNMVVFSKEHLRLFKEKSFSRYSKQELFVGLAPAKQPKFLLLMAIERENLDPAGKEREGAADSFESVGRELLASFVKNSPVEGLADAPPARSRENLQQFFISKRLSYRQAPGKVEEPVVVMPQVRGMSLRKAIQQMDKFKIRVRINGTGRIVAQYPQAGQSLLGVEECILTLQSR